MAEEAVPVLEDRVEVDAASDLERSNLSAAIARSIAQFEAGQGIPVEQAIAEIRAKRASRSRR